MDRNLRLTSIIVAVIGLLDALYLSWIKLSNTEAACLPGLGDCASVNASRYSEIYGIPVAVLGAGVFTIVMLILVFEGQPTFSSEFSKLFVFGMSLIGTLYSIYLTYLEIAVIRAICPFCVISAVSLAIIFGLSVVRLLRSSQRFA